MIAAEIRPRADGRVGSGVVTFLHAGNPVIQKLAHERLWGR
jgi:hypothetical protein